MYLLFKITIMCKEKREYTTASSKQMHARCTYIFFLAQHIFVRKCVFTYKFIMIALPRKNIYKCLHPGN